MADGHSTVFQCCNVGYEIVFGERQTRRSAQSPQIHGSHVLFGFNCETLGGLLACVQIHQVHGTIMVCLESNDDRTHLCH